ncbi:hypothetical protein [Rhodococcus sp. AQ5-07]|uniref:hypothetical protein n=1 Tax=Rhodococcus sp. AQ5-07 TaxID=2054902 RepID=UPI001F064104|nr:hypothetical protein [Rhodococcus sp. AQ5-07]
MTAANMFDKIATGGKTFADFRRGNIKKTLENIKRDIEQGPHRLTTTHVGTCSPENTRRNPRNRTIVAIKFAATKTDTSSIREGSGTPECSTNNAPLVTTNPRAKTTSPCRYCLMIPAGPRIPKVNRRFTAVLAIAESKSANIFAICDAQ